MALFVLAVNKGLCATFRTIFERMCLVHKQPIHAKLLEGYHIIFAALGLELFQPCLQRFAGALQLLNRKTLAAAGLYLRDSIGNLVDLLLKEPFLPLMADGDFLKLTVPHDSGGTWT